MSDNQYKFLSYPIYALIIFMVTIVALFGLSIYTDNYKSGYVISKRIDTALVNAKSIDANTYGIFFTIIYQEDKTSKRYIRRVSKKVYDETQPSTTKLIQFK